MLARKTNRAPESPPCTRKGNRGGPATGKLPGIRVECPFVPSSIQLSVFSFDQ